MSKYPTRDDWTKARLEDWETKRPANQKVPNSLYKKGAEVFTVSVLIDEHGRYKAKVIMLQVTSFAKYSALNRYGKKYKFRDVRIYACWKGYSMIKKTLRCDGPEGEEELPDGYYSTVNKALKYAKRKNEHNLKWIDNRPETTPETEFLDNMFSKERFQREELALSRLEKRLIKKSA